MGRVDSPEWKRFHWVYRGIKGVFHTPVKLACRVRAKGWERFPAEGPVIMVSNHWSWADPVLLQAVVPRPGQYLAKSGMWRNPVSRWLMKCTGMIKVDRTRGGNDAAVQAAAAALAEGRILGVYPEGTRSQPPALLPFRSGAARLALLTGAPVVCVGCLTDRFWPRGKLLPRFGRRCYLALDAPVVYGKDPALAEDREHVRKLTEELERRVRALLDEAAAARERNERWRYP